MVNPSAQSWVERIPAAIEKAGRLLSRDLSQAHGHETRDPCSYCLEAHQAQKVTNLGEVALARALWGLAKSPCDDTRYASHCDAGGCGYEAPADDPVLRAFVEKVEAL